MFSPVVEEQTKLMSTSFSNGNGSAFDISLDIGRNAATRVHSNPRSSADQFYWERRKINGNRKKTTRKCPFQGRNLKVTTPEEGRAKEKVETSSVAVPSEVGFFWVQ